MATDFENLKDDIRALRESILGNGTPGLKARVFRLEMIVSGGAVIIGAIAIETIKRFVFG